MTLIKKQFVEARTGLVKELGWLRPSVAVCAFRLFEAIRNCPLPPEYANNPELSRKSCECWRKILADFACISEVVCKNLILAGRKEIGEPTSLRACGTHRQKR